MSYSYPEIHGAEMGSNMRPNGSTTEAYSPPARLPYQPDFVITNVRVFNGHDVLLVPYDVTISNGIISSMVPTTKSSSRDTQSIIPTIDGTNRSLLPGLIDSHVHITRPSQLDRLLSSGITTVFDMGCFPPTLLSSIQENCTMSDDPTIPVRPKFYSAGLPATTSDSHHAKMLPFPSESKIFLDRADPRDDLQTHIRIWVQDRIDEGSEYIKIIADSPGPTPEMIRLLVQEAREQGKVSVAHAATLKTWEMAIAADVDLVTHVPFDGILGDEMMTKLTEVEGAKRPRAAVPTLTMSKAIAGFQRRIHHDAGEELVNTVMKFSSESVRKLRQAEKAGHDIVVLAGTDANDLPFAKVRHGESLIEELEVLVSGAGYTAVEALRTATNVPAKWWGLNGRGVIEVGAWADLLLVEGQPWGDLNTLRNVIGVWREGTAGVCKL